jgi:hypothetical protein
MCPASTGGGAIIAPAKENHLNRFSRGFEEEREISFQFSVFSKGKDHAVLSSLKTEH